MMHLLITHAHLTLERAPCSFAEAQLRHAISRTLELDTFDRRLCGLAAKDNDCGVCAAGSALHDGLYEFRAGGEIGEALGKSVD